MPCLPKRAAQCRSKGCVNAFVCEFSFDMLPDLVCQEHCMAPWPGAEKLWPVEFA